FYRILVTSSCLSSTSHLLFFFTISLPPRSPLFPYTTLFRSNFIERLPTTIRDVILARCCKAFGRLQLTQYQDLFATFRAIVTPRSEEHTSELQSRENLVCRLLLEKKKKRTQETHRQYNRIHP